MIAYLRGCLKFSLPMCHKPTSSFEILFMIRYIRVIYFLQLHTLLIEVGIGLVDGLLGCALMRVLWPWLVCILVWNYCFPHARQLFDLLPVPYEFAHFLDAHFSTLFKHSVMASFMPSCLMFVLIFIGFSVNDMSHTMCILYCHHVHLCLDVAL